MQRYTLYCTEAQTRKALELGAPIFPTSFNDNGKHQIFDKLNLCYYDIPTAGQMLGWLRSKGLRFKIAEYTNTTYWQYHNESSFKCGSELYYKDAVLSLIDAALDYLTNNK